MMNESLLVLFFRKEQERAGLVGRLRAKEQALLFEKRSKNFLELTDVTR
jgi:hypothetical protein